MIGRLLGLIAIGAAGLFAAGQDVAMEKIDTSYRLNEDGTGEIRYHQRVRALTAAGRTALSRVQIGYMAGFQDVEIRSVQTLKKDGSVVAGDPSSSFDANASSDPMGAYFSDSRMKVFIPPNVETGDTVEYEASVHIRRWLKPGDFWFTHRLTEGLPVTSETVVLDVPESRKIALYENPVRSGKVELAGGRRIERWETSSAGTQDAGGEPRLPLFAVSSIATWDGFGGWVQSLNKAPMTPTPEIAALAAKLTAGKQTDAERIAALYAYVATKVRYVAVEFAIGRWQPHGAGEVLRNAYGDCKDQTALLASLLTAAGFKPRVVLTTPGAGVQMRDVPSPDQFSHEFTAVETKSGLMFLDPSVGPAPAEWLAPGIRGKTALVIAEDSARLMEIPAASPVKGRFDLSVKGSITSTGAFEGSVRAETRGIAEIPLRRMFLDGTDADKEKLLTAVLGREFEGGGVRQIVHADPADLTKPFWVTYEASKQDFFPKEKTSMRVDLGTGATVVGSAPMEQQKKPSKPVPIEPFAIHITMDLAVAFPVNTGMPVHRKAGGASYDSEFTYRNGHQLLERSLVLNGDPLRPEDWDDLVALLRAIREEPGFSIERPAPVTGLPAPTMALRNGAAAFQRSDFEEAKKQYLEATRLDPQSKTAWNDLGRVYSRLKEYDKAEAAYKKQIEINPKDLYAYNNLGTVYRAQKRDDEAIAMFRKQLEVAPRDFFAHNNLSNVYASRKQWDQAAAQEAIAAEVRPADPNVLVQLGRYQVMGGHREEAVRNFDRALAMTHTALVENNVAYYLAEAGTQLDRARQLILGTLDPEARRVCEPEAIAKDDTCAAQLTRMSNWLDTAAWVIYRQGSTKEAEPYLWSAWAIAPRAAIGVHAAVILAASGRADEAVKYFAGARADPNFESLEDVEEARAALIKALGGVAQLEARLKPDGSVEGAKARVVALVEGSGKVLQAQGGDADTPAEAVAQAKKTSLTPIMWPGHSIRSIRTVELQQTGNGWVVVRSSVGQGK
jgi:tetratricopeptide (TPR) repeat protein